MEIGNLRHILLTVFLFITTQQIQLAMMEYRFRWLNFTEFIIIKFKIGLQKKYMVKMQVFLLEHQV